MHKNNLCGRQESGIFMQGVSWVGGGNFPLRYLPGSIAMMNPFSFPTSIMMDKIHGGNTVIHEAAKKCINRDNYIQILILCDNHNYIVI